MKPADELQLSLLWCERICALIQRYRGDVWEHPMWPTLVIKAATISLEWLRREMQRETRINTRDDELEISKLQQRLSAYANAKREIKARK